MTTKEIIWLSFATYLLEHKASNCIPPEVAFCDILSTHHHINEDFR